MFKVGATAVVSVAGILLVAALASGQTVLWIGVAVCAAILVPLLAGVWWEENRKKATTVGSGGVNTGGGDIQNSQVAGRDQTFNYAVSPIAALPEKWWLEENAPQLDVRPNIENAGPKGPQLLLNVYVRGGDTITPEARCSGAGVEDAPAVFMPRVASQGIKQAWQLKGIGPLALSEDGIATLTFELWFRWQRAECHSEWEWLLVKHDKGHVVLQITADDLIPKRRWRVLD